MPEAIPPSSLTEIGPEVIPPLESFPPTGTPIHEKLSSWEFYRAMGSPKRIVAPMVDQSELPWRILSRRYGAELVYTPMINAKIFVDEESKKRKSRYQDQAFNQTFDEEGATVLDLFESEAHTHPKDTDRPLLVQFCGNDPQTLLKAAEIVQARCDGVDLNLGCPQHIAKRGHYGSFLMEDWPLVFSLINILHLNLQVPVTAKMRCYESVEKTVAYARMIERAGAQIIAVHGRTRDMKGHHTGIADWQKIKAVKQAVNVPVIANGNMLYPQDWKDALEQTTADGVMSAEGNLYNPAIFVSSSATQPSEMFPDAPQYPFASLTKIVDEYLDIVAHLKTPTPSTSIKAHLFRACRPALEVHRDLREMLGKCRFDDKKLGEERITSHREFVRELERRLLLDRKDSKWQHQPDPPLPGSVSYLTPPDKNNPDPHRPAYIPHWLLQPYFRAPLPSKEELASTAGDEKRKARAERLAGAKGLSKPKTSVTKEEEEETCSMEAKDIQPQSNGVESLAETRPRSPNADAETENTQQPPEKKARVE